jgi:hypothetical protein
LLAVHVRLANGDFSVRVPPVRNAPLWRIGVSLNNLVARFARLAEAERTLVQQQMETRRLAAALVTRRMGQPAPWPEPTGGPLDEVIAALTGAPSPPYSQTTSTGLGAVDASSPPPPWDAPYRP